MINFRELFRFSTKEVSFYFNHAKICAQFRGLRLLRCQPQVESLNKQAEPEFGRLLIITPASSGNACQRGLLRRRLKNIFYKQKLYDFLGTSIIIANKNAMLLSNEQLQDFLVKNIKSFQESDQ